MSRAELLQAITELIDSFLFGANDHAEEALREEAGRWERQTVLLIQKLFAEVNIVLDAIELLEVNAHHHIHGCTAFDRSYTSDL